MLKIKDLTINGRLFLAPMSNVSAIPFRLLCKKYGASMMYSEMVNAEAYLNESFKTNKRTLFLGQERPIGIQLMGSSVESLKEAAQKAEEELKPDLIDINIGCPSYTVMNNGCGASLLDDPQKINELVSALSSSIKIPLTCKIRITKDNEKTIAIAKTIEESGASAITVHGRTADQRYSGKANWNVIKKIKDALSIPVMVNGDITDGLSAKQALDSTGCDAVMVGRACIGNPFLFRKIGHYLDTGDCLPNQTLPERMQDFFEFVALCEKYGYTNMSYIKLQAHNFTHGYEGSGVIRREISLKKSIEEIKEVLLEYSNKEIQLV